MSNTKTSCISCKMFEKNTLLLNVQKSFSMNGIYHGHVEMPCPDFLSLIFIFNIKIILFYFYSFPILLSFENILVNL